MRGIKGVRVKLVDGEYVPDEPADERDNFMKCVVCGQMFDKRDLGEVMHHASFAHDQIETVS